MEFPLRFTRFALRGLEPDNTRTQHPKQELPFIENLVFHRDSPPRLRRARTMQQFRFSGNSRGLELNPMPPGTLLLGS